MLYFGIDMKETGVCLRRRIDESGYSTKDIQNVLGLTCIQTVYKWYSGKGLPSIENLLNLAFLL